MPVVPDDILDTVVYMYPTVDAAINGIGAGGSGFIVSIASEKHTDLLFSYVVTNSHVILEGGSSVLRVNRRDGGTETIESSADS